MTLLHHSPRNASGGGNVHTLSFVPTGKSVYPEDRPQLPPVVTKV